MNNEQIAELKRLAETANQLHSTVQQEEAFWDKATPFAVMELIETIERAATARDAGTNHQRTRLDDLLAAFRRVETVMDDDKAREAIHQHVAAAVEAAEQRNAARIQHLTHERDIARRAARIALEHHVDSADLAKLRSTAGVGELYTCIGKGGEYKLIGYSNGAGSKRGERIAVYEPTHEDDVMYHRSMKEFDERMERVAATAPVDISRRELQSLEWSGSLRDDGVCPSCLNTENNGHEQDCTLAAALHAATAPVSAAEPCPDPDACNAQGCRNPLGRCEEAAPVSAAPAGDDERAKIIRGLEVAMTLADSVPTKAHEADDNDLRGLGAIVNVRGGYAAIRDGLEAARASLPPSAGAPVSAAAKTNAHGLAAVGVGEVLAHVGTNADASVSRPADGQELPALPWPESADLRNWLRDNSAGVYRKAAEAARYIEELERALAMRQPQGDDDELVKALRSTRDLLANTDGLSKNNIDNLAGEEAAKIDALLAINLHGKAAL